MNNQRSKDLQKIAQKIGLVFRNSIGSNVHKFDHLPIGRPHIGILFMLGQNKEGMSTKDIAEKLHVTPGAVTQLVDKLVEKKIVERHEDKIDRRILKVKLTPFAKNKFKNFKENYVNSISAMFNELDDNELTQLVNLLDKIKISKY